MTQTVKFKTIDGQLFDNMQDAALHDIGTLLTHMTIPGVSPEEIQRAYDACVIIGMRTVWRGQSQREAERKVQGLIRTRSQDLMRHVGSLKAMVAQVEREIVAEREMQDREIQKAFQAENARDAEETARTWAEIEANAQFNAAESDMANEVAIHVEKPSGINPSGTFLLVTGKMAMDLLRRGVVVTELQDVPGYSAETTTGSRQRKAG